MNVDDHSPEVIPFYFPLDPIMFSRLYVLQIRRLILCAARPRSNRLKVSGNLGRSTKPSLIAWFTGSRAPSCIAKSWSGPSVRLRKIHANFPSMQTNFKLVFEKPSGLKWRHYSPSPTRNPIGIERKLQIAPLVSFSNHFRTFLNPFLF